MEVNLEMFPQYDNLEFVARQVVEGFITGLHKSPFHGFSVEFAEHRLYNTGESTRHIDWKLYARTDKLFVKRYEEETNLRAQIIIDVSSSMLFPYNSKQINKLNFSIFAAASLIYLLNRQRDAVGLTLFDDDVRLHLDAKSSQVHLALMYNELRRYLQENIVKLQQRTNTAENLHKIAEMIHKRSLVILFTDMFMDNESEELFSALQHLKYAKHEVIIFHVIDKKMEEEFAFTNRPYKFIDMETGKIVKLNPAEVRESYVSKLESFVAELKVKSGLFGIDFIEADINKPVDEILKPYLIKRAKFF